MNTFLALVTQACRWAGDTCTASNIPQKRAAAHVQNAFYSPVDEDGNAQESIVAMFYVRWPRNNVLYSVKRSSLSEAPFLGPTLTSSADGQVTIRVTIPQLN
ncbi:unnamed protein product [Ixodes pacificus]